MPSNELSKDDRRWLTDPYSEAALAVRHGMDMGATLGFPVPLVGPAVGSLVGGAYGLHQALNRHAQAKDAYKRQGGKLSWIAEHPYAAGAIPTALGVLPGTAPAGLAIGDALARSAAPKDITAPETPDDEKLSRPYEFLGRNTNTGALVGMGLGGSGAVIAGRYLGNRHAGALDRVATLALNASRRAAGAVLSRTPLRYGRLADSLRYAHVPVSLPKKLWAVGGGLALGSVGAAAGATLGSLPGLVRTLSEHDQATSRASARGEKLESVVASPYVPYLIGKTLGAPVGLAGASDLALENFVEFKRQHGSAGGNLGNNSGADFGDFVKFVQKKYMPPSPAGQKTAADNTAENAGGEVGYALPTIGTAAVAGALGAGAGVPLSLKARAAERAALAGFKAAESGAEVLRKAHNVGAAFFGGQKKEAPLFKAPKTLDEAAKMLAESQLPEELKAGIRHALKLRHLKHAPLVGGLGAAALGAAVAAGGVKMYNNSHRPQEVV